MTDQRRARDGKSNHLAGETSPYLLQHLHNPVDWYPWGPDAINKAKREDKPIFISIGYAACHWCHVMERESFENPDIADLLNKHFVAIKVDREERPDLDETYMNAVQLMTGQGGWPLNMFLTPDLKPFVGGTYFPPDDRYGRLGFKRVLVRVKEAWHNRRSELETAAEDLTEQLRRIGAGLVGERSGGRVGRQDIARAIAEFSQRFDDRWGGFGGPPKFPADMAVALLLREHGRSAEKVPLQMAELTLDRMALGGMYDQIGGGFARYSVDEKWLVPHFEKMLYNQALMLPNYVDAWLITRKPLYRRVVEQTLDFVRREMTDPEGGLYSSLDADSEGEEGRFYVWTPDEVRSVLGEEDANLFCRVYGLTDGGNFEGRSIPNLLAGSLAEQAAQMDLSEEALDEKLAPVRAKLLEVREQRARPGTDDKILTAWNGLMVTAFCRAYQAFGRKEDLDSGRRAAAFILEHLVRGDRLLVSYRAGKAQLNAYLDDYAFLARGLLDLYESCFDRKYLEQAASLARIMLAQFEDKEHGGCYFTSDDHEALLTRNRSLHDGALPSGAGVAAEALLRLALHLNREDFRESAYRSLEAYASDVERAPTAYASLLLAADLAQGPVREIALIGEPEASETRSLLEVVRGRYMPNRAVALALPGAQVADLPLLAEKKGIEGRSTAYVCRNYACLEPTTDPAKLAELLEA